MRILKLLPAAILLAAFTAPASAQSGHSLPHILVYKTKVDCRGLVQVELSADGSKLTSYPAPTDVKAAPVPEKLKSGYWLSKAGISVHTAFLNTPVEEYSKRKDAPDAAALYKEIIDKSPLKELWDCGSRGSLTNRQINKLIRKKKLATKCKRMK